MRLLQCQTVVVSVRVHTTLLHSGAGCVYRCIAAVTARYDGSILPDCQTQLLTETLRPDWSTSMSRTVPRNCFAGSLMP